MRAFRKPLLAALLLISAAQPALALTLDEARHQDGETQALVKRINAGRNVEYQRIAQQNNLTTDQVARIAGAKLVERAGEGEYVRGLNGLWMQK